MANNKQMQNPQKAKNFKKAMQNLIIYCKKYVFIIILSLIFAVIGTVLMLVGPEKVREITNIITEGLHFTIDIKAITHIGMFLLIIYVVGAILTYFQGLIMTNVTQKISNNLRKDISTKINRLPLKYLDGTPHGDVLSRVTNDVDTISQTLSNSIVSFVSSIVLLIGSLIMMFITNWIMALSAIFASLIGFVFMSVIMSKSQKYFVAQQKNLGDINAHIEEYYSGHNIVKIYNGKKQVVDGFEKINNKLYDSVWKSQFFSGLMMPIMNFIGNFGYVVVCVVGALLTFNNIIDFGVIVAFIIYVRYFTQPLSQIAQSLTSFQSTAAASERVFEFLHENELEKENVKFNINEVKGNIDFKNVKFGYDKEKPVIKDFSINIKKGQKVAIVGHTGAGKTTLVNLLMRFYELDEGDITIDGISIKDISRNNLHNLFSMVLQDTWLFDGTIKENLKYNNENCTDEQIVNACTVCGVDHFIRSLPQGYNSTVKDNTTISQGQKQLLTIARAMIQNCPMLILDEATSSVDTRTEILIQNAMNKLTKGRTSFVIAHRLSTIKNADIILVMDKGDIVEQGNHEELIAKNGFYADLYNSQFEDVE